MAAEVRNSGARPGDVVAILGVGGLGHLSVQFAAKMGFKTVAIARGEDKEPLARKLGAWQSIGGGNNDPHLDHARAHRWWSDDLLGFEEPRLPEILGRSILRQRGNSVLSLPCRCLGAALGHELCADASAQCRAFHTHFIFFLVTLYFGFIKKP